MMDAQNVFFLQHNFIAERLAALNAHWDDERIYQETRRIVIAQYVHIVYNEFLPVLIGRKMMEEVGIFPLPNGFSSDYDKNVDPSILNEFSTVAYRFGHSQVQGKQRYINKSILLNIFLCKIVAIVWKVSLTRRESSRGAFCYVNNSSKHKRCTFPGTPTSSPSPWQL